MDQLAPAETTQTTTPPPPTMTTLTATVTMDTTPIINNSTINNTTSTSNNINQTADLIKSNDELFNNLTLEECEAKFEEHYENNLELLSEPKDKLSVLRSCVTLLGRLEGSNLDLFTGRVLLFLARVVPLFDLSGSNARAEFSAKELPKKVVENLEQIEAKNAEKGKSLSQHLIDHDMEEGETLSDDDSNEEAPQEDPDKIYERFWKVQKCLNSPNSLYDKNTCYAFRTHVDTLICTMENKPASLNVWKLNKSYMCESKAFALQFSDVNMRRCILVQILIVIQYLELPVETCLRPASFVVDKVQMAWFSSVCKRIYSLLDSMPNPAEGRKFLGFVRQVLRREEMWNQWKNDKCNPPKQPVEDEEIVNMRSTYFKRRKISDELCSAKPYNMHVIGSQEMSRLWNMKPSEKFNTPDIEKYLNIPEEKQAECFKDPNYSFRLLRLLRKSPHFFGQSSAVIVSLDEYLKIASTRHLNKSKI